MRRDPESRSTGNPERSEGQASALGSRSDQSLASTQRNAGELPTLANSRSGRLQTAIPIRLNANPYGQGGESPDCAVACGWLPNLPRRAWIDSTLKCTLKCTEIRII